MKLVQAMMCQLNGSHHSSQGFAALKEVGQVGDQNALRGDEEGAIENVKAVMAIIAMAFDHLRPSFSLLLSQPVVSWLGSPSSRRQWEQV